MSEEGTHAAVQAVRAAPVVRQHSPTVLSHCVVHVRQLRRKQRTSDSPQGRRLRHAGGMQPIASESTWTHGHGHKGTHPQQQ